MNQDEIMLKLFEKNSRLFREKTKPYLVSKYRKADDDNVMMEGYIAMSYFGKDFGVDIDKNWPGIYGHDEQGIDFIFIEDNVLNIITSKNGKGGYSNIDIDKLFVGLKTCYGESTTENPILENFIKNNDFTKIEEVKIFYFCKNGNKTDKTKTLIKNSIKIIEEYNKPKQFYGAKFKGINVEFLNYEDIYKNEKQIKISVPIDKDFFFSYNSDTICIARIQCKAIKDIVEKNGIDVFEKNIRGEIGGKINYNIKDSLTKDPSDFFLLNNGITIIGNKVTENGNEIIVENAQIVNGQQTSWTIKSIKNLDDNAYVLCRFFQIELSKKVRKITQTTNTQNPTDFRDFISNDEIQEAIEEYFYEKNIYYERKASKKKIKGISQKITNIELAQSTLAIILGYPSKITTPNKEKLFTDNITAKGEKKGHYSDIFSQEIVEIEKVFNNIFLKCKKEIKKGGDELKNKGWLHIGRVWYKKNCNNYSEAFKIFKDFSDKYGIEKEIRSGKNPLNRNQTDINLEFFLK